MDTVLYALLNKKINEVESVPDEKITQAVNEYLQENPITPGATPEQVTQIQKNSDNISEIKGDLSHIYESIPTLLDDSFYTNQSFEGSTYVSNRTISAGKYITEIKIISGSASTGILYLIDTITNKVLTKKEIDLIAGRNTIYWGVKADTDCFLALYNTLVMFNQTESYDENPDSYISTDGLYEMIPTIANIGDVVTIDKTSDNHFCFAMQWVEVDGSLYNAIIDKSTIVPIINPSIFEDETNYPWDSVPYSLYISDKIIHAKSVLKKVTIKCGKDLRGRIIVIDSVTKKITHAKETDFKVGWNTVYLYSQIESDSMIGLECSAVLFNSGSTEFNSEYTFCTKGLYEGSPIGCEVGGTLTIECSDPYNYFIFAVQWECINNEVAYFANEISSYHASNGKLEFKLDNGNLLSYEDIPESIGYMGRWFEYNGKPCTNNDGSEMYFKVKGANNISAVFEQITSQAVTPYIAVSIDGGAFTRQQISISTIPLPDTSEHIVRIVIDGMTEAQGGSKWNGTLGVYVDSITVDSGTISGIYPRNKVGLFYGDSITEGVNALGTGATAEQNSATESYPYYCCKALNAVSYRVGYGATGLASTGSFNTCANAIDYLYDGKNVESLSPDFIVINHGVNDSGHTSSADFINKYNEVISKLRVKYGNVPIFCVVPFTESQPYALDIKNMCDMYSNTYYISSAGWNGDTTDGIHLSIAGAKNNGELLASVILKVLGTSYFINLH